MKYLIALATSLAFAAPASAGDSLPVGRCINMGNSFEVSEVGKSGVSNAGAEDFARIARAGFETIRLPVRWSDKTGAEPGYTIEKKWMAQVDKAVDQALGAGLNVILNDHHFDALDDDPAANSAKLAAIWRQVAGHFADRPTDRLWFEIENEPHNKLTNANLLATLNPALAEIRATNPDRPVIIGGEFWSGIDSLATLKLPDDPNVYPTFHYYEPFDFTHQGATWAGDPPPAIGRSYGTEDDAARLVRDVAKIRAYVERTGKVPFMGETGAYEGYIAPPERAAYHRAVREAFAPTGIGICAWAYTNTFPFYDHEAGKWIPGMLAAFGLPEQP
ncbi:glycoside hydrolase family 5 protein [Croceibacterium aestuarii]|uniref:glycoside hydrolase family 5 protein n=1 Tax=Croceibacterium aestuarii TaxID=3064139 RepID=UPI00272E5ED6|nr:glycoside hydrolase family 5 protein [Croceibacterium sp. D39]